MEIVYFLVPAAILLAVISLIAFIWASRSGQFDDLETPAMRVLFDEDPQGKSVPKKTNGGTKQPVAADHNERY